MWTTTPWTLPANLLLAVGADIDYARVSCDGEECILAKARVEALFGEREYKVLGVQKGSELAGMRYRRPFDYLQVEQVEKAGAFRVVTADFVDVEDGSGIVHVAPAYGVDDLALGKREGMPVMHAVGLDGCFTDEVPPVAGKFLRRPTRR